MRSRVFQGIAFVPHFSARACTNDTVNPALLPQAPGDEALIQRLTVDSGGAAPTLKKMDAGWTQSLGDREEPLIDLP